MSQSVGQVLGLLRDSAATVLLLHKPHPKIIDWGPGNQMGKNSIGNHMLLNAIWV